MTMVIIIITLTQMIGKTSQILTSTLLILIDQNMLLQREQGLH